jgi:hypothetical protein
LGKRTIVGSSIFPLFTQDLEALFARVKVASVTLDRFANITFLLKNG